MMKFTALQSLFPTPPQRPKPRPPAPLSGNAPAAAPPRQTDDAAATPFADGAAQLKRMKPPSASRSGRATEKTLEKSLKRASAALRVAVDARVKIQRRLARRAAAAGVDGAAAAAAQRRVEALRAREAKALREIKRCASSLAAIEKRRAEPYAPTQTSLNERFVIAETKARVAEMREARAERKTLARRLEKTELTLDATRWRTRHAEKPSRTVRALEGARDKLAARIDALRSREKALLAIVAATAASMRDVSDVSEAGADLDLSEDEVADALAAARFGPGDGVPEFIEIPTPRLRGA